MKLYVGNLSYTTTEDTLRENFSNYGEVVSVTIMKDRYTEQSKGFAFVEMANDTMGERGIGGMNGKTVDGRRLRVSPAVEKARKPVQRERKSDWRPDHSYRTEKPAAHERKAGPARSSSSSEEY